MTTTSSASARTEKHSNPSGSVNSRRSGDPFFSPSDPGHLFDLFFDPAADYSSCFDKASVKNQRSMLTIPFCQVKIIDHLSRPIVHEKYGRRSFLQYRHRRSFLGVEKDHLEEKNILQFFSSKQYSLKII